MESISVIVLNYNGKRYLDDCLRSLADQTYSDFEVIVVDNGSTDGSTEYGGAHARACGRGNVCIQDALSRRQDQLCRHVHLSQRCSLGPRDV